MGNTGRKLRLNMSKISMAVNMLLLLAGLLYVITITVSGYNDCLWYKLSVMLLMVGYSVLFNISALYNMQAFDNMTRQQGRDYFGYMIFDAVELCFLAMFVVNVSDYDEPFHYISLGVFLVLTIPRHLLYHGAVDGIKNGNERPKQQDRRLRERHRERSTDLAKARKSEELFEEPKLREDRFVSMKLDGYTGGRSVDESGNIKPDTSVKKV